jgi:hypothetical protein
MVSGTVSPDAIELTDDQSDASSAPETVPDTISKDTTGDDAREASSEHDHEQ